MPGNPASAELTPEGHLYTGWAEYELRFGRHLAPWSQPTRTLPNPSLPLYASSLSNGAVRYTQSVFAVPVQGRPVAYETLLVRNTSKHPTIARLALAIAYARGPQVIGADGTPTTAYRYARPVSGGSLGSYSQPGQTFSTSFEYSVAGRDLDRSGLLLARGPAWGSRSVTTPAEPESRIAPHDEQVFRVRLRGHRQARLTWQIPLDPPAAGSTADRALDRVPLARARTLLRALWAREETGMTVISVPEPRVGAAYRAALVQILDSRIHTSAGWMQCPNRLQYQAFWIRDAAVETQALDLAGLHSRASENLAFVDAFQQPDGLFISQEGQYDGWGQALWALAQHAALTRSPAYAAAQLDRIGSAIQWLLATTASDPLGLLPATSLDDDEQLSGHITGDDLWAAVGLRAAVADALLAGQDALAASWQQDTERFESALQQALAAATARAGYIPPALDVPGGQDWGNYGAAFPEPVLSPTSTAVQETLAWAQSHMVDGLPTYKGGHSLHGYLGFRIFETELDTGDVTAAVNGLYAELAHTTATDGGWELLPAPYGERASRTDLAPHGTFAADYVALLRNMLVRETSTGTVALLSGASPAWLAPGRRISVSHAASAHGSLSFEERASRGGEWLHWRAGAAARGKLVWVLPSWARNSRLRGKRVGHSIVLRDSSGTLAVRFGGHRPNQSYARAVKALNSSYRSSGQPAPLVLASG